MDKYRLLSGLSLLLVIQSSLLKKLSRDDWVALSVEPLPFAFDSGPDLRS